MTKMRTKNFLIILSCIITTSLVLIIIGPSGSGTDNESTLRTIFTQTNQQIQNLKYSVVIEESNQFNVDEKYLQLLGFSGVGGVGAGVGLSSSSSVGGGVGGAGDAFVNAPQQKLVNFSIVTYVLGNQLASAVQIAKNINLNWPSEHLLIYDLGLSEDDQRTLQKYCYPIGNGSASATTTTPSLVTLSLAPSLPSAPLITQAASGSISSAPSAVSSSNYLTTVAGLTYNTSKCFLVKFDLLGSGFPSFVIDDPQMHAYRPLIIKDALRRAHSILFLENSVRIRPSTAVSELLDLKQAAEAGGSSGVKGWRTKTPQAVSSTTHPKMYDYFHTDDDNFKFLKMISLDSVFFVDRETTVIEKILLPWIKCSLTPECIHPIGAQSSGGCKYNKKPQYRYSGCHDHDLSALNIILGLTFNFEDQKYALDCDWDAIFYTETLEQSVRIMEMKQKNISDTSEHPFTEE